MMGLEPTTFRMASVTGLWTAMVRAHGPGFCALNRSPLSPFVPVACYHCITTSDALAVFTSDELVAADGTAFNVATEMMNPRDWRSAIVAGIVRENAAIDEVPDRQGFDFARFSVAGNLGLTEGTTHF
jgi:hypothetical protein